MKIAGCRVSTPGRCSGTFGARFMTQLRALTGTVDFYFMRHGESEGNRDGIMQGRTPFRLTETGRAQAREMGAWFRGRGIDLVLTSPLPRASETAAIVAAAAGTTRGTGRRRTDGDRDGHLHGAAVHRSTGPLSRRVEGLPAAELGGSAGGRANPGAPGQGWQAVGHARGACRGRQEADPLRHPQRVPPVDHTLHVRRTDVDAPLFSLGQLRRLSPARDEHGTGRRRFRPHGHLDDDQHGRAATLLLRSAAGWRARLNAHWRARLNAHWRARLNAHWRARLNAHWRARR